MTAAGAFISLNLKEATTMARLSAILAVEKGVKATAASRRDALHSIAGVPNRWAGIIKTYEPRDAENGVRLPPQTTLVQVSAEQWFTEVEETLTRMFDVVATKDQANTQAFADVVMPDGEIIIDAVPVTTLLFLEKNLTDLQTMVAALPVADASKRWVWNPQTSAWETPDRESFQMQKVMKNHVVARATEKHPEQVQVYNEDVPVGTWTTRELSGALSPAQKKVVVDRIIALSEAVKKAREEANSIEVQDVKIAERVFSFLFEGVV